MRFTNEEIQLMRDNTKQIEEYLKTLQPQLRDTVTVRFGDMTERRGDYGFLVRETEYEICLNHRDLFGFAGGLRFEFAAPSSVKSSCATSVYAGFGIEYMAKLIRDWPYIKTKLLEAIDKQTAAVSCLKGFKV